MVALLEETEMRNAFGELHKIKGEINLHQDGTIVNPQEGFKREEPK